MDRYSELSRRAYASLSAEERVELRMLPDPHLPAEQDGSGLARVFFMFTAEEEGLDLDELMVVLNEKIRAYLLENEYVKEINSTEEGEFSRYSWGDMVDRWDQMFER